MLITKTLRMVTLAMLAGQALLSPTHVSHAKQAYIAIAISLMANPLLASSISKTADSKPAFLLLHS